MGSSPSTQDSQNHDVKQERKSQTNSVHVRQSLKVLKNKNIEEEGDNPERQVEDNPSVNEFKDVQLPKSGKIPVKNIKIPRQNGGIDYQEAARQHVPKRVMDSHEQDEDSEIVERDRRNQVHRQQMVNQRGRASKLRQSQPLIEQQIIHPAEHAKMRYGGSHHEIQDSDNIHNSSIIAKNHKKQIEHKGIDYQQFTPYSIRHKAKVELLAEQRHAHQKQQHHSKYDIQEEHQKDSRGKILSGKGNHDQSPLEENYQNGKPINVQHRRLKHAEQEEHEPKIQHNFRRHSRHGQQVSDHVQEQPKSKRQIQNEQVHEDSHYFKRSKATPIVIPSQLKITQEQLQRGKKYNDDLEQKSIADYNKDRSVAGEYQYDENDLVVCREGCGRSFNPESIKKHQMVCKRVFQKKRREFNAQNQRLVHKDQVRFMKKGEIEEEELKNKKKQEKIQKWRAQSIALRAHVKMGLDQHYQPTKQEMEMLSQERHIDVVNCPFCGRHFNKNAAKAHVPFCKSQVQKELQKQRFQRHPHGSKRHN